MTWCGPRDPNINHVRTLSPPTLPPTSTGHVCLFVCVATVFSARPSTALARGRLQEMAIGLVQGRMLDILNSVNDCIDHVPPVGTEYEFEVRQGCLPCCGLCGR